MGGRGSNGTKKYKQEKRKRMELEGVTSACMRILNMHGYNIKTPSEIPHHLQVLLSAGATHPAPQTAVATTPLQLAPDVVHQTQIAVHAGLGDAPDQSWDIENYEPNEQPPVLADPDLSIPDDMLQAYEDGNDRMMERVAAKGVQYKHGQQGPASGQRIAPHRSVAPAPQAAPTQHAAPPSRGATIGAADLMVPEGPLGDPQEEVIVSPAGPHDDHINPHTGLTLGEQRRLVGGAMGHTPDAPPGGRPNTIK